jgi:hypothetical protein
LCGDGFSARFFFFPLATLVSLETSSLSALAAPAFRSESAKLRVLPLAFSVLSPLVSAKATAKTLSFLCGEVFGFGVGLGDSSGDGEFGASLQNSSRFLPVALLRLKDKAANDRAKREKTTNGNVTLLRSKQSVTHDQPVTKPPLCRLHR